ncbi:S9 family peptidase [Haliangium sp.]|uniref:S9 family peptidase n=1 Tax=Haliangium sp. TaxID=2663208 RepID=UPI003D122F1B
MATQAPYGSWTSPITAPLITAAGVALSEIHLADGWVYWREGRPLEHGRGVVMRRRLPAPGADLGALADPEEVTPADRNVRTRVHEYGGGAYLVHAGSVLFSNDADQRLYRQDGGAAPRPITPAPERPGALRYADGRVTPDGRWVVCVRERHQDDGAVVNELVAVPADGAGEPIVLTSGHDFYAAPRISPDGGHLAWIAWDHPNMPWDGTELWVARLGDGRVHDPVRVAGGAAESVLEPRWRPGGGLCFVSDRSGWWNLYLAPAPVSDPSESQPLAPMEAEFSGPLWLFGMSNYAFLADGRVACIYTCDGVDHLAILTPGQPRPTPVALPFTHLRSLRSDDHGRLCMIAASARQSSAVIVLDLADGSHQVLARSMDTELDLAYLTEPQAIEFPSADGVTSHALYYPPKNADFEAPAGERPPLLVMSHGGPTAATSSALNPMIQFWTSRGFAVADVNYGGSTGYGRAYRERLRGRWGLVDTADCIAAARHLADQGLVDGARMAIRGGSAGGYTTLCALVFHDVFAAGASYYGVADLEALARETHKFESRYLDGLIGPYPEAAERYHERSPVHAFDRLSCPLIIFQGLEDRVVPPSQADAMTAVLDAKALPHAYVPYEGEQHGFRKAENIRHAIESELYFYAKVFGFEPAGAIAPVAIAHLRG